MTSLASRRAARRPDVQEKLRHMALRLHPLVQVNTGLVHPAFPATVLHFWLLTDDQLDALAHFYHQRTPGLWSDCYPCPVAWPREGLGLEDKRRKLGRFIGLRGCETPGLRQAALSASMDGAPGAAETLCVGDDAGGRCALDAQPFCYACSMRTVKDLMLETTTTTATPSVLAKRPSSSSSSTRTSCYARRERAQSRSRAPSRPRSRTRPQPAMLTVEDVLRHAQLSRLVGASEEALRLKLGYYR